MDIRPCKIRRMLGVILYVAGTEPEWLSSCYKEIKGILVDTVTLV
jgi:hypothetical protein